MRGYLDTRWGQLHYSSEGKGPGTIVLLHETPLDHGAFRRLAPLLTGSFRVIAFDTPGYGQSDPPPQVIDMPEYARTLAQGIDALGLGRMMLYGCHTGASLAFALAVGPLSGRLNGLVMSGFPYYTDEVRARKVVPAVPGLQADGSHLLETFCWEPDAYDPEMRSRLVSGVSVDRIGAYRAFPAVFTYQPARVTHQLSCPVLLLSNPHDPLFSGDRRIREEIPESRQVLVDSDRLPLYWTQPETVAAEIIDFAGTQLRADGSSARQA
jgi:pimeloyl-ACP methyl ester carboxylesterase